jgi:hypothetical protein
MNPASLHRRKLKLGLGIAFLCGIAALGAARLQGDQQNEARNDQAQSASRLSAGGAKRSIRAAGDQPVRTEQPSGSFDEPDELIQDALEGRLAVEAPSTKDVHVEVVEPLQVGDLSPEQRKVYYEAQVRTAEDRVAHLQSTVKELQADPRLDATERDTILARMRDELATIQTRLGAARAQLSANGT